MGHTTVSDAVERRRSIRAFKDTAIDHKMVREILDKARRAPSGGNVQPWQVDVISGPAVESLKEKMMERIVSQESEPLQYDIYPPKLWEPHRTYRYKVGEEMYATINVARDDKLGRLRQFAENYRFFGAPVGLFFSMDKKFGPPQWSDLGMLMQTIMLLAVERGIDTCAQESWSTYPETIRRFFGWDDDRILFSGMAMGYRDDDHPINTLRTARAPIDDFVRFHHDKT